MKRAKPIGHHRLDCLNARCYKLNLRGVDVSQYEKNPIVVKDGDFTKRIGKAEILMHKRFVNIFFLERYSNIFNDENKWIVTPINWIPLDFSKKEVLVALSISPVMKETCYENN